MPSSQPRRPRKYRIDSKDLQIPCTGCTRRFHNTSARAHHQFYCKGFIKKEAEAGRPRRAWVDVKSRPPPILKYSPKYLERRAAMMRAAELHAYYTPSRHYRGELYEHLNPAAAQPGSSATHQEENLTPNEDSSRDVDPNPLTPSQPFDAIPLPSFTVLPEHHESPRLEAISPSFFPNHLPYLVPVEALPLLAFYPASASIPQLYPTTPEHTAFPSTSTSVDPLSFDSASYPVMPETYIPEPLLAESTNWEGEEDPALRAFYEDIFLDPALSAFDLPALGQEPQEQFFSDASSYGFEDYQGSDLENF